METNTPIIDRAKLRRAFRLMRKRGLVARQGFTCCNTCGQSQIAVENPRPTRWAFYHKQDAEHLPAGPLWIGYGSFDADGTQGTDRLEVGAIVRDCLVRAGLEPSWDGDPDMKIMVIGRRSSLAKNGGTT